MNTRRERKEAEAMPHSSIGPSSAREEVSITGGLVIERVVEVLVDVPELVEMQANDHLLKLMRAFRSDIQTKNRCLG